MSAQPPKLYEVEVSFTYYVAARGEVEARRTARRYMDDAMRDCDEAYPWPLEVKSLKNLPAEWRDEIPYADRDLNLGDKTCAQVVDPTLPPKPDESKGPVHWCDECALERVQFDGLKDRNLCAECLKTEAIAA